MTIQISYFSNGGFVVHKALDGRVSAWFTAEGVLIDCERRVSENYLKPSLAQQKDLARIGKLYAPETAKFQAMDGTYTIEGDPSA